MTIRALLTPLAVRKRLTELAERIPDEWLDRNELISIDRSVTDLEKLVDLTADRDEQRKGRSERWADAERARQEAVEQARRAFLLRGGHITRADEPVVDDTDEKPSAPVAETGGIVIEDARAARASIAATSPDVLELDEDGEWINPPAAPVSGPPPGSKAAKKKK